jgi:hypothetical protein
VLSHYLTKPKATSRLTRLIDSMEEFAELAKDQPLKAGVL